MSKKASSTRRPNDALLRDVAPVVSTLLEAQEYAADAGRPLHEFAVEIEQLTRLGVTHSLLRWLICRGIVEHFRDITALQHASRDLIPGNLALGADSCFVISTEGRELWKAWSVRQRRDLPARDVERFHPEGSRNGHVLVATTEVSLGSLRPSWNQELHELRWDGRLVKRFRLPSPNQERVIQAFEEQDWACRVDDPLPPVADLETKRRLHDCIRNLNRNQRNALIRFRGDGTGQGVLWESCSPRPAGQKTTA